MKLGRIALLVALLAMSVFAGPAYSANCDADRARFPKNWKDVAAETPVLTCRSRYINLKVFLTPRPESGVMLTVVGDRSVYRANIGERAADRIKQQKGLYILYSEKTCFIRGNYSSPAVLSFADDPMSNSFNFLFAAGSLDAFECEPAK
jgi:hypothetical protein